MVRTTKHLHSFIDADVLHVTSDLFGPKVFSFLMDGRLPELFPSDKSSFVPQSLTRQYRDAEGGFLVERCHRRMLGHTGVLSFIHGAHFLDRQRRGRQDPATALRINDGERTGTVKQSRERDGAFKRRARCPKLRARRSAVCSNPNECAHIDTSQ